MTEILDAMNIGMTEADWFSRLIFALVAAALGLASGVGLEIFAVICAILAASLLAASRFMEYRSADDRPDGD
jgi:hypothetical protein